MATIADNPFPSTTGTPSGGFPPSSDLAPGLGSSASNGAASASPAGSSAPAPAKGDLLGTVVQGAHSAIDRLAEAAAPAVHRLQEGVSSTSGALSERAEHVREMGDEWAESLRVTVRENPLAAVATAVALGILISKLTQR